MAYPEPIEYDSAESLYKQACLFWREYERVKREKDVIEAQLTAERVRCESLLLKIEKLNK